MHDHEVDYKNILRLHEAALPLQDYLGRAARSAIEAGENAFPLEWIAGAYLRNNAPMPPDLFALFETMAADMELEADPEYAAVAELRARGPLPIDSQGRPGHP